jgi:electron-transferring-flavoprotein dehydrogenase
MCYERADDLTFGVSGAVTRACGIRASLPGLDPEQIPMMATVRDERVAYLLDPRRASRRSPMIHFGDGMIRALGLAHDHAVELPDIPPFLHKQGGLVLSLGQFLQHVGSDLMGSGTVQIWPGTPVHEALIESGRVTGVRLADQGVDRTGAPRSISCLGWTSAPRSPSSAMAQSARSAANSIPNSAFPTIITSATGPSA